MMAWYPGKVLESLRQRTRTRFQDRFPRRTLGSPQADFEYTILDVGYNLEEASKDVDSAIHELRETIELRGLLSSLNEKLGRKYSGVIGVLDKIEPVQETLRNTLYEINSIRNELVRQLKLAGLERLVYEGD